MKNLIILVFLSGFIFLGCSENDSILSPAGSSNFEQNTSLSSPNWITVGSKAKSLSKSSSKTLDVAWTEGGTITINETELGETTPWVESSIRFQAESWDTELMGDTVNFYFEVDNVTTTSTFGPHIVFSKPSICNVKYTGLDLTGIANPDNVEFVYTDSDGSLEYPPCDTVIVNVAGGILEVKNARIPHFSRYGFTE